jgi:hypothetical protein
MRFEERFNISLPRCLGRAGFLYFDELYQPYLLPIRYKSSLFWPVSGCAVDFRRTLLPFTERLQGRKISVCSDRPVWLKLFSGFSAIAIWVLLPLFFNFFYDEMTPRHFPIQKYTSKNGYTLVRRLLNNSDIFIFAKGRFPGSLDLSQDLLSFGSPDVTLRIEVMLSEVLHNSVNQLAHAPEAAGQDRLLAQVSEEAFD